MSNFSKEEIEAAFVESYGTQSIYYRLLEDYEAGRLPKGVSDVIDLQCALTRAEATLAKRAEELREAHRKLAVLFDSAVFSDSLGVYGSEFSVCRWCGGGSSPGKGDFAHNEGCLFDDDALEKKVASVWEEAQP